MVTVAPDPADPSTLGDGTLSVHVGNSMDPASGAVRTPLTLSNSYALPYDPREVDWTVTDQLLYTRVSGINQLALQRKLAALEHAEDAVVLASGVAATHAVLFTYLNSGDHVVVSREVYEATYNLFVELLPRKYGITADLVDITDLDAVRAAMRPETRFIFTETIANPTTTIADLPALGELARAHGALLVVDATYTPPPRFRALEHGADLVVHSLTKYINGHGDALGGVVVGRTSLIDPIKQQAMVDVGGVISPFNAWLIQRGTSTLPLRLERVIQTAQTVAEWLESDSRIEWVRYVGLDAHPQRHLARQMFPAGATGMLAFAPTGGPDRFNAFVARLRLIANATSFGHDETLIVHVGASGMRQDLYGEPFTATGTLRLSIGLENAADLIADLDQALAATEA